MGKNAKNWKANLNLTDKFLERILTYHPREINITVNSMLYIYLKKSAHPFKIAPGTTFHITFLKYPTFYQVFVKLHVIYQWELCDSAQAGRVFSTSILRFSRIRMFEVTLFVILLRGNLLIRHPMRRRQSRKFPTTLAVPKRSDLYRY